MSSSHSQVGYLIHLNHNFEDEKQNASIPKLPISDGTNIIGRNNLAVTDKRLSRKHLTITASTDGTANLHVVCINSLILRIFYNKKC
jgi:tyrosyl-DNA phosphodiesterase-1